MKNNRGSGSQANPNWKEIRGWHLLKKAGNKLGSLTLCQGGHNPIFPPLPLTFIQGEGDGIPAMALRPGSPGGWSLAAGGTKEGWPALDELLPDSSRCGTYSSSSLVKSHSWHLVVFLRYPGQIYLWPYSPLNVHVWLQLTAMGTGLSQDIHTFEMPTYSGITLRARFYSQLLGYISTVSPSSSVEVLTNKVEFGLYV